MYTRLKKMRRYLYHKIQDDITEDMDRVLRARISPNIRHNYIGYYTNIIDRALCPLYMPIFEVVWKYNDKKSSK
jgi:hypothetical protein